MSGLVFENIGIGYNLLDGSPTDSPDPGVLLQKRILQVVALYAVILLLVTPYSIIRVHVSFKV